jgi:thiol-disulfide isomerase/thioredoxin
MADADDATRTWISGALVVVAAGLVFAAFSYAQPTTQPLPKPTPAPVVRPPVPGRQAAPGFTLPTVDGTPVSLASLKGRVVLVDFWATWCPPCRAEMPWLVTLAKRWESRGVTFVAISEDDPPDQLPLVQKFADQIPGLGRYAVLGNPEVEAQYGVENLPSLFVIDRAGNVVTRLVGATQEAVVEQLLERTTTE